MSAEHSPARVAYRLPEAAQLAGVSVSTIKNLVRTGELPTLKLGRARLVLAATLIEFLASLESGAQ